MSQAPLLFLGTCPTPARLPPPPCISWTVCADLPRLLRDDRPPAHHPPGRKHIGGLGGHQLSAAPARAAASRLPRRRARRGRVVPASDLPPVQGDAREAHGGAATGVRPVGRADRTAPRGVPGAADRRRRI